MTEVPGLDERSGPRPHLLYFAIGFPPAAKSSAFRMRETANQFAAAGWDVTVVTIAEESWLRDSGVDHTLSESVDERIRIVELPLSRADLETDIRLYSEERALDPVKWLSGFRAEALKSFPEPVFGGWRGALETAALELYRERPADLVLASCVPYVQLAAVRRLWEEHRAPYAVDFRDGWSLDVIDGVEAFPKASEAGRWESDLLENALSLWVVNDQIADFYRARYPEHAERIHVVRNGYDRDSVPEVEVRPTEGRSLVFGHLGTVSFSVPLLESVLAAWRTAREREPLLADARFEVRGHIGAGANREANRHVEVLRAAADDGVVVGGAVPKAEVAGVYGAWDALVLVIIGGPFMTSGKVYEYMATGLPIVSMHAADHDASRLLEGHPLWTGPRGLDEERLADAFCEAARMVVEATPAQRAAARDHGTGYARDSLMASAVEGLTALALAQKPALSGGSGS
ncbi:glycosyltransferase [Streptomyces sp. NPDC007094]|uniref:glycosyltransferase n=1 Tax=Streptomyces sp. NPDC007094 TaxID=3155359 RepID=UPI0033DB77FD